VALIAHQPYVNCVCQCRAYFYEWLAQSQAAYWSEATCLKQRMWSQPRHLRA